MSVSIQRSIVEQFNFNGKTVRSVYVKGTGECMVAADVYRAVGYDKESGLKAIQRLVLEKYKARVGDVSTELEEVDRIVHLHPNLVLLKEPGLYCFLLRCKMPNAEPFLEWVVETVLHRKVRKLTEQLEEKDSAIALLNDDLAEAPEHSRQLEYNNVGLQGEIHAKDEEIHR